MSVLYYTPILVNFNIYTIPNHQLVMHEDINGDNLLSIIILYLQYNNYIIEYGKNMVVLGSDRDPGLHPHYCCFMLHSCGKGAWGHKLH